MTTRTQAKKFVFEQKPAIAKVWWEYYCKEAEHEEGYNRWNEMTNEAVVNDFLDFFEAMKNVEGAPDH